MPHRKKQASIRKCLTFDDILILPNRSDVEFEDISLATRFSRNVSLNIPLVSAAMDTVTESRTAIVLAQLGGLGVIHRNLSIQSQADEIEKVKRFESGVIPNPVTLGPDASVKEAVELMKKYNISGLPILQGRKLVGILTSRDLNFISNFNQPVRNVMTRENLVTAPINTTMEQAKKILQKHKVEKLPLLDKDGNFKGLITIKDIFKNINYPLAAKDSKDRLIAAAALGVEPSLERAGALVEAGVDVIVVDKAHAFTSGVIDKVKSVKKNFKNVDVVAGNIVEREAARALIQAGADGLKIGIGPGSICTTRVIAGVGMPQISAVMECAMEAAKSKIPVIADGGIKYSGDIVKALAVGGSTVMLGNLLAGTDTTPGEVVYYQGRSYKVYRGMGSVEAMKEGGKERYFQAGEFDVSKLIPEGIVGRVPYKGALEEVIYQLLGGLKSGMVYTGSRTLADLRKRSRIVEITGPGLTESHPHDVSIIKEAPNYRTV
jgi:IMP dehydrogenase